MQLEHTLADKLPQKKDACDTGIPAHACINRSGNTPSATRLI